MKNPSTKAHLTAQKTNKINSKRFYWLGHDKASSQDTFFVEALDPELWTQGDSNNWDTCWYTGMPDADTFEQLGANKTINHIPGNNALTIKSYLNDSLVEAKQHATDTNNHKRYDFFPDTYSMPEDYYRFQAEAAAKPKQLWIQKPKNLSRGRGIEVVKHPETIPLDSDWLIQRYLSDPHLYAGRKYVLRFYVLITSVEPLRCYWYKEGFAKLASESYNEEDLDNLYRHLTNPDINEENTKLDNPVTFFTFKQYRTWLKENGHDDTALFDQFKDLITLTVIAAREKMRRACQAKDADTQGCYELIGLDCMVDNNLKPWILECNLSPSLDTYASAADGANDEATIKRQLVHDLVNMLQLNTKDDLKSKTEGASEETQHQGDFEQLFPGDKPDHYLSCFPVPRYSDIKSIPDDMPIDYTKINLSPRNDNEYLFSDSLALLSNIKQNDEPHFFQPDDIATWIWIKNSEGLSPQVIAQELKENTPTPVGNSEEDYYNQLLKQVWDTLADWAQAGVFDSKKKNIEQQDIEQKKWKAPTPNDTWAYEYFLTIDSNTSININTACSVAAQYLSPLLQSTVIQDTLTSNTLLATTISIINTQSGYSLLCGTAMTKEHLKLSELMPAIIDSYFETILAPEKNDNHLPLLCTNVIQLKNRHFLLINNITQDIFSDTSDYNLLRDIHISSSYNRIKQASNTLEPSLLPLRKPIGYKTNNSIVAEECLQPYRLTQNTASSVNEINIDAVIYLNPCDDTSSNTRSDHGSNISPLAKATALVKLWPCILNKTPDTASLLAEWLEANNIYQFEINKDTEIKSLLALLLEQTNKQTDLSTEPA